MSSFSTSIQSFSMACGGMSFAPSAVYVAGGSENRVLVCLSSLEDKTSHHLKAFFGGLPAVLKA